ncbi:unnamed protein product [Blepharisma stoltei]|uniref:Uncharacterized protein n=1 Tax=Blepharisma stoltei TaxID=1481888 RepID=A0AAU9K975_9CILI|nr:unnamed protein product [Blepharisma stoltei]
MIVLTRECTILWTRWRLYTSIWRRKRQWEVKWFVKTWHKHFNLGVYKCRRRHPYCSLSACICLERRHFDNLGRKQRPRLFKWCLYIQINL